jgi:hypothetical protein
MAMTYDELKENVQDITEMTFSPAQLSMFTKQAEQKIYGFIKDLPLLKKATNPVSYNGTVSYTLPADCLYVHVVYQQLASGTRVPLIPKSVQFMREAYPESPESTLTDNKLKYYALTNSFSNNEAGARLELETAPRFNATITIVFEYQYQPLSIVDINPSTSQQQPWLGVNYDSALLNATLVEAARFMKAEPDIIQLYEQQFVVSLQPLVDTVNVKLKQDSFRPRSAPAQPLTVPAPAQPPQREG